MSGHAFAVKVIDLKRYPVPKRALGQVRREIKTLLGLHHVHELSSFVLLSELSPLTTRHRKTSLSSSATTNSTPKRPEIFMPLRDGNLQSLAKSSRRKWTDDQLGTAVLEQMLSALDYLACKDVVHRDVKPGNILYWENQGDYVFQLADFGLANRETLAKTKCGTGYYEAPELSPEITRVISAQSPKMDVWSLFATIADIHPLFLFPPKDATGYNDVLCAVQAAALLEPRLEPMARLDPKKRASAAQLLVALFEGRGLTTPRSKVDPIDPASTPPVDPTSVPTPQMQTAEPVTPAAAVESQLATMPRSPRQLRRQDAGWSPLASPYIRPLIQDSAAPVLPRVLRRPMGGRVTKSKTLSRPGTPTTNGFTALFEQEQRRRLAGNAPAAATARPGDRKEAPRFRMDMPRLPGSFPN